MIHNHYSMHLGRWAILRKGICATKSRVIQKITACFALHNYVQTRIGVWDTMQEVATEALDSVILYFFFQVHKITIVLIASIAP
jgi:hypothetical protein